MSHRFVSMGVLAAGIAAVTLVPAPVRGQVKTAAAKTTSKASAWTLPRTAWGQPDLQGIWDFATITPLERPKELAGKEVLTEEEAADFERKELGRRNADRRDGGAQADVGRAYNHFWWDYGTKVVGSKRTSLIVDPPDGRIPPLTPEAQKRADARAAVMRRPAAGPEDRNLWERCILGETPARPWFLALTTTTPSSSRLRDTW